jgi:phosphate-selective porin OprO/OprP
MRKSVSKITLTSLGLAALVGFAQPSAAQSTEERIANLEAKIKGMETASKGSALVVTWDKGLNLNSVDGNFKVKIGGRLHNDWTWGDQADDLEDAGLIFEDGVEFRRARLGISGTIYKNVMFKAEYDFAGSTDVAFKDVFLALKGIPVLGTFKVGHFKEPFSLEELTSSNYITFMERGLPNVFAPGRNTGMQFSNNVKELEDKLGWAFGVFKETGDSGDNIGGAAATKWAITARAYFVPMYENKGEQVVHLGLGLTRRATDGVGAMYSQRPENHLAPNLVSTGAIADAESTLSIGAEAAAVYGPFSGQLEYIHTMVTSDAEDDPSFGGFYLYGSWFVTGETRNYKMHGGSFDRITPAANFDMEGGLGAIELALRFSHLDLDDLATADAGKMWTITAGVNWHLNPNTRVMLNVLHANLDRGTVDDSGNTVAVRFQWDF